jgi:hypothetical protein
MVKVERFTQEEIDYRESGSKLIEITQRLFKGVFEIIALVSSVFVLI